MEAPSACNCSGILSIATKNSWKNDQGDYETVFDIAATDGEPLCDLPWKVKGDCAELLPNAEQACRELGIELEYKAITGGAEGYSLGGRIQINETLGSSDRVAVIIHELSPRFASQEYRNAEEHHAPTARTGSRGDIVFCGLSLAGAS